MKGTGAAAVAADACCPDAEMKRIPPRRSVEQFPFGSQQCGPQINIKEKQMLAFVFAGENMCFRRIS